LHRQNLQFDPELSLVAEVAGKVSGHLFFYPRNFYLAGELVKGVVLSPLAVDPGLQRQGIGGLLIVEGHRRAAEKGYAFSILLGHPTYYPRFGYQTHMYGTCLTRIDYVNLPNVILEEREVRLEDIPLLREMWHHWFSDNSLALDPGDSILDWISPNIEIRTVIVMNNGNAMGYLRYKGSEPLQPRFFLAAKQTDTVDLMGHIRALGIRAGCDSKQIQLPVHPESKRTMDWIPFNYTAEITPWDAAMICVLDEHCYAIHKYVERAQQKAGSIGSILWPVEFELV
jgi:putative acetyltransferase